MRKVYRAWHIYKSKNISGITFLRDAVRWFDDRLEANNSGKGPIRLLMDFAEYTLAMEREFQN